jgi:F-type H+-transporting ATPase subunit delta
MIAGSLARRYARALLEIGIERKTTEKLADELDMLASMYSASRDLMEALTNPVFPMSKRRDVLVAILDKAKVDTVMRNVVLLLLERERIPYLPAIARELRAMVDELVGRVRATITTVRPMAPAQVKAVTASLVTLSGGKEVVVERKEDPAILGGVVARIGDVVYDGSIRTQLERMRERILAE